MATTNELIRSHIEGLKRNAEKGRLDLEHILDLFELMLKEIESLQMSVKYPGGSVTTQ